MLVPQQRFGGDQVTTENQPSEEELRAAYEAEIKKIRVEHVLLEQVVSLINLGMRRTGLAPGTESERDPEQVRLAIEGVRAVLPLIETSAPEQIGPIREGLSRLQLAFVRIGGQAEGAASGAEGSGSGGGSGSGPGPGSGSGSGEAGGGEGPGPGGPGPGGAGTGTQPPPSREEEGGPAQRSGRLWVPGQ
jgi:hypothetical protein